MGNPWSGVAVSLQDDRESVPFDVWRSWDDMAGTIRSTHAAQSTGPISLCPTTGVVLAPYVSETPGICAVRTR